MGIFQYSHLAHNITKFIPWSSFILIFIRVSFKTSNLTVSTNQFTPHTSLYHKNLFYLWHFRKVIVSKLKTFPLNKYLRKGFNLLITLMFLIVQYFPELFRRLVYRSQIINYETYSSCKTKFSNVIYNKIYDCQLREFLPWARSQAAALPFVNLAPWKNKPTFLNWSVVIRVSLLHP